MSRCFSTYIVFATLAALVAVGCAGRQKPCPCALKDAKAASKRSKVELYVMSKCPHGVDAERGIAGAMRALGDQIDLHIDYIVDEKEGTFRALHGPEEIAGNTVQLCVAERHSTAKTLGFIGCMNRQMNAIPHNWKACARAEGIAIAVIEGCMKGPEGAKLLRASMARAAHAKASGSPTILIDGKPYEGGRGAMDFVRAVCGALKGDAPIACKQLPVQVAVTMVVLSDKRCGDACDTSEYEVGLKVRYLPKLTIKKVDYSSAEGKALYAKLKLKKLPAVLLSKDVERAEKYPLLGRFVRPTRDPTYRRLHVPAKWDPTAEICDNKKDDTGNGKVDCQDPSCSGKLVCRTEKKRELHAFVMSQCPYGAMAMLAMKEVLANFKGKITFDVHFIADRKPDGKFAALHGASEVAENIRQLCAKKHYKKGNRYLDYVWCRSHSFQSNAWRACAKGPIKPKVIERCATSAEGVDLLAKDIRLAQSLGITASPTLLANNIHTFNAISAEDIKAGICKVNKGLAGCEKTLSKAVAPASTCGDE